MSTTEDVEPTSKVSRRTMMLGAAAAAIVVAGGAGYYLWGRSGDTRIVEPIGGADVPMAELMQAGPLGDHVLGNPNAPVTVIEYASLTCPHCAHFHETTYPDLKKKYIDTGKVRFVFREFPLDQLALAGSLLARCAGKDKFFPMLEALFSQQKDWVVQKPLQPLLAIAKQAGFTQQSFDACLENQQLIQGIEETRTRAAQKLNVSSTPTFFINGKIHRGAITMEEFDKQVAPYLKS
jgi:protein-disulfide isomerase